MIHFVKVWRPPKWQASTSSHAASECSRKSPPTTKPCVCNWRSGRGNACRFLSPNNFSHKVKSSRSEESNAPIDHRFWWADNDSVSDPASYTAAGHLRVDPRGSRILYGSQVRTPSIELRQTVKEDKSVQASSDLALTVEEALNDAHAVVFPLDVSQLQVAEV